MEDSDMAAPIETHRLVKPGEFDGVWQLGVDQGSPGPLGDATARVIVDEPIEHGNGRGGFHAATVAKDTEGLGFLEQLNRLASQVSCVIIGNMASVRDHQGLFAGDILHFSGHNRVEWLFCRTRYSKLAPCLHRFTTPASQNPQELAVDIPTLLCQYRAMLGEIRKPILPHPRSAQYE
jgi:hypothetical protein